MPISYVIGDTVVSDDEYDVKVALGSIGRFRAEAEGDPQATLQFSRGIVNAQDVLGVGERSFDLTPAFSPVQIGAPLSIEILTVYTGNAPRKLFGKPDLLVASQVKSFQTFEAAPRLVNQLVENIADNQYVAPSARTPGSPIVYYAPAVTDGTILCSFDLVAETFNKDTFAQVSTLIGAAAGLPVFAPASAYLIGGSILVKIFGDLANALLRTRRFLTADLELRFDTPNVPIAIAKQVIAYNKGDGRELANYKPALVKIGPDQEQTALVHEETGEEYQGGAPYMIVSIDGRPRQDLNDFAPKLASAAMLDRFYQSQDTGGLVLETMESALGLYNDFSYHQKAASTKKLMGTLDPNSKEYANAKALLNAYAGNIQNDLFKVEGVEE